MTIMTLAERNKYLRLATPLFKILIQSGSKLEFSRCSLNYLSSIFDDTDVPPNVYYKLNKLRAELLEASDWK